MYSKGGTLNLKLKHVYITYIDMHIYLQQLMIIFSFSHHLMKQYKDTMLKIYLEIGKPAPSTLK